jgi:putative phage-type endonuclease
MTPFEEIKQGSAEWFGVRLGRVTASRVADVIAKTKSGYSASRATYMSELIVERLTGKRVDSFVSSAMMWGTNTEPMARAAFESLTGELVQEVGFVPHHSIPMAGASPDGFVGLDGLIEIKCPNTATHIETLLSKEVAPKYVTQMQWQMACAVAEHCDFVSYDPRMPEGMQLFKKRVFRDDEVIAELEKEVSKFLDEIDDKIMRLMTPDGEL